MVAWHKFTFFLTERAFPDLFVYIGMKNVEMLLCCVGFAKYG